MKHTPRYDAYLEARKAYDDFIGRPCIFFDVPYSGRRPTIDAYETFTRRARAAKMYLARTGDEVGARTLLNSGKTFVRDLLSPEELLVVDGYGS